MILKTETPQDFRECTDLLERNGYTHVFAKIRPANIQGVNFIDIEHKIALFAITTKARADKDGYCNYQDSQFIKNLKK